MIKKIFLVILGLIVLIIGIVIVLYSVDKNKRLAKLSSDSQLAETSVGTIEYKIYGDKGPVILFLHGTGASYDGTNGFQPEGYRVLAPSRPGYLRTPLEVGKTPAEQARAYSALLEALNIEKVVVNGVSGGGPSAICFAALYPENTSALILLIAVSQSLPSSESDEDPFFMKSDFSTWALFFLMQNDSVLKSQIKMLIPDQNISQLLIEDPEKIKLIKGLVWSTWPPSKRSLGVQNDINQFLSLVLPASKVKVPTLIIHGSEDENVPVSQSKKLAEQIPGSKLVIIEGVDHIGIISKKEETDKILNEFLERVSAEKSGEKTLLPMSH